MENLKVKIVTGFRKEQHYTIGAEEAHKAYYLFLNPDQRGVFNNGIAIIGSDIRAIEPDLNATMGWNVTHQLDSDDWNEIRQNGADRKLREVMQCAQAIARENPERINLPLNDDDIKKLTE